MSLQLIQTGKYSRVDYDPDQDAFIKTFTPNTRDRWRYRLGIRRYPGYNFRHVARRLEALGISTPEILSVERYRLVTANIHGTPLHDEICNDPQLQTQFVEILVTLFEHRIHCRGLHTNNFLVSEGDIIAIDLDAYKAPRFFHYSRQEFIDCLSRSLKGKEAFLFQNFLKRLDRSQDR
ncbi:hypothetical protein [Halomonas huangheensis]|uniref:Aminoglycoside phosphotransferase domain-containing protein n=1 Tax=Halomonas huangheensis TaxID=1178482 RepID=W1N521_9GAMM|nr:hypothetical protein [Halomonas huangheensis]ALM52105.1 hypothetical protein AR456_07270 [Halomonas huangheensis]ERL50667.1 hypothetical protein BJB45_05915 [Halomonas huangheensis]